MDIKKLTLRALSGIIYIGVMVGLISCGSLGVLVLALLLAALASPELNRLTSSADRPKPKDIYLVDAFAVASAPLIASPSDTLSTLGLVLLPALVMLRLTMAVYRPAQKDSMMWLCESLMQYVYLGIPLTAMVYLANPSGWLVLALLVMVWMNDTGAYLVGCTIGRHKLIERVSPNKTWEGFFGGMAFSAGAGLLIGYLVNPQTVWGEGNGYLPAWVWAIFGVCTCIFATWGDLVESYIKRSLGKKDSGTLIPGHGGILDRIDSLLFVMPGMAIVIYVIDCFI